MKVDAPPPPAALAPCALALPAQFFDGRPGELSALALLRPGGRPRLVERRFGPDLEAALFYASQGDVGGIEAALEPSAPIRVAATASASLSWIAWVDGAGLAASPRRLLHQTMSLALPDGACEITAALETPGHDLVLIVIVPGRGPEAEFSEILACRFQAPVEQVVPPDAEGPEDWDDIDLVPGPVSCNRVGGFSGRAAGRCAVALAPGGEEVRLLVPVAAGPDLQLVHIVIGDAGARVSGTANFARARLLPGGPPALRVDAQGRSVGVVLALEAAAGQAPEPNAGAAAATALQPLLLSACFGAAAVEPQSLPCVGTFDSMPVSSAVACSFIAAEHDCWRAAVAFADGRVLVTDDEGRFVAAATGDPVLLPLGLLASREVSYLVTVSAQGPQLAAVLES